MNEEDLDHPPFPPQAESDHEEDLDHTPFPQPPPQAVSHLANLPI